MLNIGSTSQTPLLSTAAPKNATKTLLYICPTERKSYTLTANVNQTTVKDVKDTIARNVGGSLTSDNIRLLHAGRMLEDDKLLSDYDSANDIEKLQVSWRNIQSQAPQAGKNEDPGCCTLF